MPEPQPSSTEFICASCATNKGLELLDDTDSYLGDCRSCGAKNWVRPVADYRFAPEN